MKDCPPTSNIERRQFLELTKRLIDVMTSFCLLTLESIGKKKQAPLNTEQIEEIINFDLQYRLQQINDPRLLEIVRDNARSEFYKYQKKARVYL